MNIKNIVLISLTSITFISNGLAWRGYDLWSGDYGENDFRCQTATFPFPIIFHYNYNKGGGLNSTWSEARISKKEMLIADVPETIKQVLVGIDDVEVYEAYCKLEQAECNYFTHTWSMDHMVENRNTIIASGVYGAKNIGAIAGQIGINSLVEQGMSFHDTVYLSGNSARFKIVDMNQVAEGWFVSYYDPARNANCGNVAINQKKKAIIVHWTFIPKNLFNVEKLPSLKNVIENWDKEDVKPDLKPQFIPSCSLPAQSATETQIPAVQIGAPAVSQPAPKKSIFKKFGTARSQQVAPVTQAPAVQISAPAAPQSAPKKSIFKKFGKK